MGDCNETLRELEQFLVEELSEGAHDAIHAHLHGCTDCLEAFDFHAELRQVIALKCGNDELPPGLMEKIQSCFALDVE
jgi:mycothiol system anti-sigma-R factor